ncbi:MAG TPA: glycoside hydrolase [Candidatus Binatia bacterium]|nr:glycoside hydrolase [Candidatus Binatia bacterium]
MISIRRISPALCLSLTLALHLFAPLLRSQQVNTAILGEMRWRNIGPYRGGRTRAIDGVPAQPNVFYAGAVNGGVWKTTDYGRTWTPIFDREPTGSIGAIAVAPSDPNVVYVGSGEGLHRPDLSVGDGIYKSSDAGATWTHLGLREGQQISQLAVDPRDPNRLFAAVAGHPYGPNPERGIYRSSDGGQTFEKVLYRDENIGGNDVRIDPANPEIVYATLWEAREGPWENGEFNGTGGGIFRSADGGQTWKQLAGGLPAGVVQAYVAISRSNPKRLFATVATKEKVELYRSDDAGATWATVTTDPRPKARIGGGDLPVPAIDPEDPEGVYVASTVTWKSTDGGRTWTGWRGAPGGDDYQNIWINPANPEIILLASDQGAIVTVNGGASWSSWYNQPTAQLYHVNADNAFPYRLCSGQQESGSVCIASRGNDGEITFRDWHPVAAEEYGYVVPDPTDPDTVFGGKLTRYDRRTAQGQNIMPVPLSRPDFRVIRTQPIVFSPFDPHLMYFAANVLWATRDGGRSWKQISPDLTRKSFEVPPTVGVFRSEPAAQPRQRGVIYALAPSPVDQQRMWVGTDDGLIWLTADGGAHWNNVSPPQLSAWQKVSVLEASHSDAQTAWAAVNTLRLDDLRPHIYRTRDSGTSWREITTGIPGDENVNAVREDPGRKGLLFAGTERAVYVSLDDGDHWQSLRLNMPATSVRDLLIKDNDLAVATHGRGFWILDDITPLRQLDDRVTAGRAYLFAPEPAYRVRWDTNSDTPLPPDVAAGDNPPDGAIFNYYLKSSSSPAVTLEVKDSAGNSVRRFSTADPVPPPDPRLAIPDYWLRPPQRLSGAAGFHRFVWDMHYAPVPGIRPEYPIAAVYRNTAPVPTSPSIMPGKYTAVLTVDGQQYGQPLTVEMDPRVKTPVAELQRQFELSNQLYQDLLALQPLVERAATARAQLKTMREKTTGAQAGSLDELSRRLESLAGGEGRRRRGPQAENLAGVRGSLLQLLAILQEVDQPPTTQATAAVPKLHQSTTTVIQRWEQFENGELAPLGIHR